VDFGHIAIAEVLDEIHYSRRKRPSGSPGHMGGGRHV
jgi:hypothetical protein